jgi:hypothetical protein
MVLSSRAIAAFLPYRSKDHHSVVMASDGGGRDRSGSRADEAARVHSGTREWAPRMCDRRELTRTRSYELSGPCRSRCGMHARR